MIRADISNVWCSVSLPELLQNERRLYDTHMEMAGGEYRKNGLFGWLSLSGSLRRTWLSGITRAAEEIRSRSEILVVVGMGQTVAGARAALRQFLGRRAPTPRLLFLGDSYSADDWLDVASALEGRDFSVLVCSPTGNETAPLVILRALCRIMEKRYGDEMGKRIYVAVPEGQNALRSLAASGKYGLLEHPAEPVGSRSALSAGGLLIMAAAGMNADLIFDGALAGFEACDARNLDNPAWLRAAARVALAEKGIRDEFLCTPSPASAELGQWWAKTVSGWSRDGKGIRASSLRLFADLSTAGGLLFDGEDAHFATVLRLPPDRRKASVEMQWKNEDNLRSLAGQDFGYLNDRMLDAVQNAMTESGVPFVTVECADPMTDDKIAELLYFAEFSSALSAQTMGLAPSLHPAGRDLLEKTEL